MASYLEIESLMGNVDLMKKIKSALIISAFTYIDGVSPTADQRKWSGAVLEEPGNGESKKALRIILAKNKSASVATITSASDATIQSNIDSVLDELVTDYGLNG